MNNPCISIIVPCYKVENYLDRCLNSLVNQTLFHVEIILVDDGSPDKIPEMCEEWKKRDSRIKVIHKDNGGLGYARNSGLEVATGEYVAFVDSDDYVELNMYEILYGEAKSNNADVVFCGYYVETRRDTWNKCIDYQERQSFLGDDINRYLLDMIACAPNVRTERKHSMSVWHGIYKRSLLKEKRITFLSERIVVSEDLPFHVDVLMNAKIVNYTPNAFYYYCLNGTSLTSNYLPEKYERFKFLHSILVTKMRNDPEALLRIDRFMIGYTRKHLLSLYKSNRNDKNDIMNKIVHDSIWNEIGIRYKPAYLPLYSKLFYWLQLYKQVKILELYIYILLWIKKHFVSRQG